MLLLDEPTAALDEETERRRAGRDPRSGRPGRTVVLVTHRAAPLEIADHVVHLAPTGPPAGTTPRADRDRLSAVGPW